MKSSPLTIAKALIVVSLTFASILQSQEVTQSFGGRFADPAGDTEGENAGDFDLTGLKLHTDGSSSLSATIVTQTPIAPKPKAMRSWYGLYLDLDRDSSTGLSMSDNGMDVVFSIEASGGNKDPQWKLTQNTMSEFAKAYKFNLESFSITGNQAKMTVTSKAFAKHPVPIVSVWSHRSGQFMDNVEALKNSPLELFPQTGSGKHQIPFTIQKSFDVEAGKYSQPRLPIYDDTKEVDLNISIRRPYVNKWLSCVQLRLYDAKEERQAEFRIALSVQKKDASVVRVHIGGESEKPHYPKRPYVGEHHLKLIFNDSGEMEFYVGGERIETHRKTFSIAEARLHVCSTETDVKVTIKQR